MRLSWADLGGSRPTPPLSKSPKDILCISKYKMAAGSHLDKSWLDHNSGTIHHKMYCDASFSTNLRPLNPFFISFLHFTENNSRWLLAAILDSIMAIPINVSATICHRNYNDTSFPEFDDLRHLNSFWIFLIKKICSYTGFLYLFICLDLFVIEAIMMHHFSGNLKH